MADQSTSTLEKTYILSMDMPMEARLVVDMATVRRLLIMKRKEAMTMDTVTVTATLRKTTTDMLMIITTTAMVLTKQR